jgi:ArsR family transcriptional regulator
MSEAKSTIDVQSASWVAELFHTLGDPLRIQTFALRIKCELNVSSIAESLSVSPSSVSHHLRNVRQLRLVNVRREGKRMISSINGSTF